MSIEMHEVVELDDDVLDSVTGGAKREIVRAIPIPGPEPFTQRELSILNNY
jgi:hypothetical protein